MTKKFVNIEALKHKFYDVRDKLNPHDFREGKIIEGMNVVNDLIDELAKIEDSEMSSWAQKEIELAIASEKKSAEGTDDWKYGVDCYESAMKAYEVVLEDNHSGMSIQITKSILNRLIDGKCLTPIEDADDVWNDITGDHQDVRVFQCKRMSSFFKRVDKDGNVTYSDIDRITCVDITDPAMAYHNSLATQLVEKIFPIKMPYLPPVRPYKVFTEELGNGIAYLYILLPNGQKIDLNRYFKEENGKMIPINEQEWNAHKTAYKK